MHFEWNIELQLGNRNLIDVVVRVFHFIAAVLATAAWRRLQVIGIVCLEHLSRFADLQRLR